MLKKVLALMLAVMMIFGLCTVTAFADGEGETPADTTPAETTEYPKIGEVQTDGDATITGNIVEIGKIFQLKNADTNSPEETFYLIQTDKDVSDSSETKTTMPDLVKLNDDSYTGGYEGDGYLVGEITFAEGAATVVGVRQNIEVELPAYTAVGVYTYWLQEVINTTAGITYWNNPIKLVVTVMTTDEGTFYVAAVHCEEETETPAEVEPDEPTGEPAEELAKKDNFTNVYEAGKFSVAKTVTGSLGDRDKYFEFTVTFEGESGKDYSTATGITYDGGSAGLAITGENIDTTNKVIDITGLGTGEKTVTFYLKHGDTVTFDNIPYGVKYTYAEADYSAEADGGYKTTYPKKASGENDPETGDPVMVNNNTDIVVNDDTNGASYTVTNDKDRDIDTGIFDLDNLPYIMALAVVLIGGVVFFVSKKRIKAEDRV